MLERRSVHCRERWISKAWTDVGSGGFSGSGQMPGAEGLAGPAQIQVAGFNTARRSGVFVAGAQTVGACGFC